MERCGAIVYGQRCTMPAANGRRGLCLAHVPGNMITPGHEDPEGTARGFMRAMAAERVRRRPWPGRRS